MTTGADRVADEHKHNWGLIPIAFAAVLSKSLPYLWPGGRQDADERRAISRCKVDRPAMLL